MIIIKYFKLKEFKIDLMISVDMIVSEVLSLTKALYFIIVTLSSLTTKNMLGNLKCLVVGLGVLICYRLKG